MRDYTFDDYKKMIEEHLMDFMPDVDHKSITLYESMKYSLSAGGKRIRPVLLLAACGFISGFPGLLYLLFRGMLAMAVFGVIQLIRTKVQVKSSLPLAPFLLFGALI